MHLSTDEPAASRMLEPFGEVGGDAPEYFLSQTHFANIEDKKFLQKNKSKNLTARVKALSLLEATFAVYFCTLQFRPRSTIWH